MDLPTSPPDAVAKAGRAISSALLGSDPEPIVEEVEENFDDRDEDPVASSRPTVRLSVDVPGTAGTRTGGLRAESSLDSSDESSEDSRARRRDKRRKKRPRRSHRRSRGSRRYSGITDVLDMEFTDDESISPPRASTRKTQASKFVQDTADSDVEDADIILRKEDYGVMGTQEYRKNMTLATKPSETPFGVTGEGITDRIGGE